MLKGGALRLLCLHPDKDSEGHGGVSELTHTRHLKAQLSCNHAHTRTFTCRHTHTHDLSLYYFIKVADGVHTHTHRHALREYRGNVSSAQKVFHYLASNSPECSMSTLVHWMNWFISFGDNATVSVLS